jgi:hypothetical protein
MKVKSNLLNLTVTIILFTSCTQKDSDLKQIQKIRFDPSESTDGYLEKEMEDFYFVPLGTNKEFLITRIEKIFFTENEIIVTDRGGESIFVFDRKGNCKYKVQESGKGPGEYSNMTDALYDEKKKQLEVLDNLGKKILYYSLMGEFLYEKQIPDYYKLAGSRFYKNKGIYYFDRVQGASKDGRRISLYDEKQMGFMRSFLPIPKQMVNFRYVYHHAIDTYKNTVYYLPDMDDKIYKFSPDSIIPVYELDYPGKTKIDQNGPERLIKFISYQSYMNSHGHIFNLSHLFINDRYIAFSYQYKLHPWPLGLFYSKRTGKFKAFEWLRSSNNPDIGLSTIIKGMAGEYYVMDIPSSSNKFLPEAIRKNLTDSSNPVLLFFKLKDF